MDLDDLKGRFAGKLLNEAEDTAPFDPRGLLNPGKTLS
jgi:hypothetical protein